MDGILKRLIVDRPADREPLVRYRYAAVAGVLCAGASLCTLASSILLESAPAMTAIGLASFGLLLAFLCFAVPWGQVARSLVHLAPATATLAVAIATTTIDPTYGFYLVLVAGFVAYAFRGREVIALHLGLIAMALVAPVVIEPEGTRKAIACALIFGPGVIGVTVLAVYLRRSSEARERAYREFAADAMALASRIRSRVGDASVPAPDLVEQPAPGLPSRSVGVARIVRPVPAPAEVATARPTSLQQRMPMTAIAIAASVIAAISTTAALLRDGGERRVAADTAPALVRQDTARSAAGPQTVAADRPARRHRSGRTGGQGAEAAPVATPAPAAPAAPAASDPATGGGGTAQPAQPAPTSNGPAPVPVRPQASGAAEPPPEPVQQGAPAAPTDAAVDVVDQTVGTVVDGLQK